MKVLLIGSHAGSLVNFRGPLIKALISRGHQVSIIAPDIPPDISITLNNMGASFHDIKMQRTGLNVVQDAAYLYRLWRQMNRTKPDLVLTYTIKPNIWGAFAARLSGIRSAAMVTGLGYAFTTGIDGAGCKQAIIRKLAVKLYARATRCNDKVVFQNPDDVNDFIAAGCLHDKSKACLVNGSGVSMSYYERAPLPDAPIFLMVARLLKNKGVREYAAAGTALKRTHPTARFQLVGYFDEGPDGILQSDLDAWCANGLEYLGPQDDVRPFIAAARTFVLPSYREGTPRSVLEAMAMGRPIITTDVPGCRETVIDGETGFLVPAKEVEGLTRAMIHFVENPVVCASMAEKSYQLARDKYDVNKVNAVLMKQLGL